MQTVSLVFDIIVSLCLIATIIYAIILHRDVKKLLSQKTELERVMRAATDRIQTSERNFKAIQIAAQEAGNELDDQVLKAKEFTSELNFLLEAGENLAGRLTDRASDSHARTEMVKTSKTVSDDLRQINAPDKKPNMSKAEQDFALRLAGGQL